MLKRIIDMKPHESGTIAQISGGHGLIRRLETMGVRPGVTIVKRSSQPLRGPVTIRVHGSELALGYGIACRIHVEVGE